MSITRTDTHYYPSQEIWAMNGFYGGKVCLLSRAVDWPSSWSHILNDAISSSTLRLAWMLQRKLRVDRHPAHAAEVRENLIPLRDDLHNSMVLTPCHLTLYLHEDVLAKTLSYELDVKAWRMQEVLAGRGDPGRPEYASGYPTVDPNITRVSNSTNYGPVTLHRLHYNPTSRPSLPILRVEGGEVNSYQRDQCPGVGTASQPFPVIETLLSVSFSLLHNVPRLASFVNLSEYQLRVLWMGQEIVALWGWDPPSPPQPAIVGGVAVTNAGRLPSPPPVFHNSRSGVTYAMFSSYPALSMPDNVQPPTTSVTQVSSGQLIDNALPSLLHTTDGLKLVSSQDSEAFTQEKTLPEDTLTPWESSSCVSIAISTLSSELELEECPPTPSMAPCILDIQVWAEAIPPEVHECAPSPVISDPLVRGTSMGTMNDYLMIRGLISPPTYLQYLDLTTLPELDCRTLRI